MHIKLQDLILETHLQDLYHATFTSALYSILKNNALKLTFGVGASADDTLNKRYPFFLSTSRVKYSDFARAGTDPKTDTHYNVVIHLDGHNLQQNGYKMFPVNYWGAMNKPEQEERIVSNKDEITPLSKYITDIHVYAGGDGKEITEPQQLKALVKINELSSKFPFPIYFYPPGKETAFKTQRPNLGGTTDVKQLNISMPKWTSYDIDRLQFKKKQTALKKASGRSATSYLDALLKIYNNQPLDTTRFSADQNTHNNLLYNNLRDTIASVSVDIHNTKHLPVYKELAQAMRQEKTTTLKEFVERVRYMVLDREKLEPDA